MSEPQHEMQSVADIAKDLVEYEPVLRGVVVFTVDMAGVGRVAMGGGLRVSEIRVMISTLQLLEANQAQVTKLMGMEAQGNA